MKRRVTGSLCSMVLLTGFLLGIHNGKVALWEDGDPEPMKVFPISASKLPEEHQKILQIGISIESMDELKRLAREYLS